MVVGYHQFRKHPYKSLPHHIGKSYEIAICCPNIHIEISKAIDFEHNPLANTVGGVSSHKLVVDSCKKKGARSRLSLDQTLRLVHG